MAFITSISEVIEMQRKLFVKFPVPFLMKSETAVTFARCGTVTSILLRLGFGDALLLKTGPGLGA